MPLIDEHPPSTLPRGYNNARPFSPASRAVRYIQSVRGKLGPQQSEKLEIIGLYWHFVDVVWIVIFTIVYLFPQ